MERRAVPLADPMAWTRIPVRLFVVLCVLTLLAASVVVSIQPVAASDVNARMAGIRASQASTQASMRALDAQVERLQGQRIAANKARKAAERQRKGAVAALTSARAVLQERRARLARVTAEYAIPNLAPDPDRYRERLREIRVAIRLAEARVKDMAARVNAQTRLVRSRQSQLRNLANQRKAATARRSGAEASLSYLIKQMAGLARIKAEEQATVSLLGSSAAFSWPTTGRIVQGYGCTGFHLNPRKGSCKHFHDGIDVVSGYGTPVRAVAVGVVSYSGWNPYDKEGRAYVVDIVHPDGFTSRYGHLIATNHVRAGELVHTGQVIGKMGSTGKSTGTHLHFELLKSGNDVNPVAYLPAGVVNVDKTTTRAGAAERTRKTTAKQQPKVELPKPKPGRTRSYPTAEWKDYENFQLCPGKNKGGAECDPEALLARLGAASDGAPGVPIPYRETVRAPA